MTFLTTLIGLVVAAYNTLVTDIVELGVSLVFAGMGMCSAITGEPIMTEGAFQRRRPWHTPGPRATDCSAASYHGTRDDPDVRLFQPRSVKKLERAEDKERMMVRFDEEDSSGAPVSVRDRDGEAAASAAE